jgi:hypothetical protein
LFSPPSFTFQPSIKPNVNPPWTAEACTIIAHTAACLFPPLLLSPFLLPRRNQSSRSLTAFLPHTLAILNLWTLVPAFLLPPPPHTASPFFRILHTSRAHFQPVDTYPLSFNPLPDNALTIYRPHIVAVSSSFNSRTPIRAPSHASFVVVVFASPSFTVSSK